MEFSQNRDDTWDVYEKGDWIGFAKQLPSGRWAFIGRFADVVGISVTLEGAVIAYKKEVENENRVFTQ